MNPIAVILPSRGLVFTRTLEWIEKQREKYLLTVYYSHDLPIPECFNKLVCKALKNGHTYLLFLEEDIVPPHDALDRLIKGMDGGQITCIDYPFRGGLNNVSKDHDGRILSCGTGCTLVCRGVFDILEKPYFRSNMRYDYLTKKWSRVKPHEVYGLHDMWFTFQARHCGCTIVQVKGECKHLGLTALGKPTVNDGCHQIDERQKITNKLIPIDFY